MIITNKQAKVFYYDRVRILPGSNVIENGEIDVNHPTIKALISDGVLEIDEVINDETAGRAIEQANTQETVEEIMKNTPKASKATKEKAEKRKKALDDFDTKVRDEIEAARKAKEESET